MNKGKGKKLEEWWTLITWNTLVNSSIFLIREEMHNLGSGLAFTVVEPCSSSLVQFMMGKNEDLDKNINLLYLDLDKNINLLMLLRETRLGFSRGQGPQLPLL